MVLAKKFGYITIVAAVPGSPADKAGLTTGDMLESIKGIATRDMPLAYAKLLLKGDAGIDHRSFGAAPQTGTAEADADPRRDRVSAGRIEDDAGSDRLHQGGGSASGQGEGSGDGGERVCRSRARRS